MIAPNFSQYGRLCPFSLDCDCILDLQLLQDAFQEHRQPGNDLFASF